MKKRIGIAVALAVLIGMVWTVLSNQGKIAGQQTRDTAKLDAIAEGQKSDHALLERFIKAQGGAASLSIGQVGESGYERALRIVADEKKISVDEARNGGRPLTIW